MRMVHAPTIMRIETFSFLPQNFGVQLEPSIDQLDGSVEAS